MIEIKADELIIKYCPKNGSILELGNQIMNLEFVQDVSAKIYYSNKGYNHTSIDKNGLDGALPFDLSKPIEYNTLNLGQFDMVTDIGTMEHVEDLYNCLMNVFNLCANGGIIIHKNPKTGSFNDGYHEGTHHFKMQFWKEYAELCNIEIIELFEYPIYHNTIDGWEVVVVLKKKDNSIMPTKEQFDKISQFISNK